jgi:hypothetical protein
MMTPRAEALRIFGLAAGGVCHAGDVTTAAVRSYRTISPLLEEAQNSERRTQSEDCESLFDLRSALSDLRFPERYLSVALSVGFAPMMSGTSPPWCYQAPCPVQFGLSSPVDIKTPPARSPRLPQRTYL